MRTCGRVIVLQNSSLEVISCYSNIIELKKECGRSFEKCDFSNLEQGLIICDGREYKVSVMEVVG